MSDISLLSATVQSWGFITKTIYCTEDESSVFKSHTYTHTHTHITVCMIFIPIFVHPPTDILAQTVQWKQAALRSQQTIRVFPAASSDVLNNNSSGLQLSSHAIRLHRYSTCAEHTQSACKRDQMTEMDASAAFIIFQYAGCVTRPSSCYTVSMFLTAQNQRESERWVHGILHLLRQRCYTEWTDSLTECWMISLEHPDEGLSRLKSHVFNLAALIKAAT